MHSYEIEEDIRSTIWSIGKVREGKLDQDEKFLLGRMYAIMDYASGWITETFGAECEYDAEANVIKDDRGRIYFNKDGRTYIEEDEEVAS